jgi:hypothetical protein
MTHAPFNSADLRKQIPFRNPYSSEGRVNFRTDNHFVMVYTNQNLHPWHASRKVVPNKKLTLELCKPVGYFVVHQGKWFINQTLAGLKDVDANKPIPPGSSVELTDGRKLLLNRDDGGRLIHLQIVKA